MGLFDNLKVLGSNVGKNVSVMADNVAVAAKENQKISSMKKEISVLDAEIEKAYVEIGRKLVDHILITNEMPDIAIQDILTILDGKMSKKKEISEELLVIEKAKKDQLIFHEKERVNELYRTEKEKLDKALAMDVISKLEYEEKLRPIKNRVFYFDEIRKIEKQCEMGIINQEEKSFKIEEIINRDTEVL